MRYRCGQFLAIAWSRISPCSGSERSSPGSRLHFLAHHDAHNLGTSTHFIGVGVSAVMASVAALALTVVGVRRQDGRVVLVGSAFTVMAALLAIHGLATPGVVIGNNGVISAHREPQRCPSAEPSSRSPHCPRLRRPRASAHSSSSRRLRCRRDRAWHRRHGRAEPRPGCPRAREPPGDRRSRRRRRSSTRCSSCGP